VGQEVVEVMKSSVVVALTVLFLTGCLSKPALWTPDGLVGDGARSDVEVRQADGKSDVREDTLEVRPDLEVLPLDANTQEGQAEVECKPNCDGKECGDDGCGGSCGTCGKFGGCKEDGTCACDYDKCLGTCCAEDEVCLNVGCCLPDCEDKECGEDGCGGICGECSDEQQCGEGGRCECLYEECGSECCQSADEVCHEDACCLPDCADKECGTDGCGDVCGVCPGPNDECQDDACVCEPDCVGKECGPDGCDGLCGECGGDLVCSAGGDCIVDPCIEVCFVFDCGFVEGCQCGSCPPGQECLWNMCECQPICLDEETGDAFECGDDGCGGVCGECGEGYVCDTDGTCQLECDYSSIVFSSPAQKVVWEEVGNGGHPGEALDVDNDPDTCAPTDNCSGGCNNQMYDLMGQLENFMDVDAEIQTALEEGTRVTLAECVGLNLDGAPFTVNIYFGVIVEEKNVCDFQQQKCAYLATREHIDPISCQPRFSFDNAVVEEGQLSAGGPGYEFPFAGFAPFPDMLLIISGHDALMVGTVEELAGGAVQLVDGIIGYAVVKSEFINSVDALDGADLPVSKEMIKNLLE